MDYIAPPTTQLLPVRQQAIARPVAKRLDLDFPPMVGEAAAAAAGAAPGAGMLMLQQRASALHSTQFVAQHHLPVGDAAAFADRPGPSSSPSATGLKQQGSVRSPLLDVDSSSMELAASRPLPQQQQRLSLSPAGAGAPPGFGSAGGISLGWPAHGHPQLHPSNVHFQPFSMAVPQVVLGAAAGATTATASSGVAASDPHAPCRAELEAAQHELAEAEHLLAEERVGREADAEAAVEERKAAIAAAVSSAVTAATSKLELRLAELLHALEAEKLKTVELETALMEAVSAHEREKAAWALDKQSLLAEAEVGYAGLARSVADRAEGTIVALRGELRDALRRVEEERVKADRAEAGARDEARKAAAAAVDSATRDLRQQLERERAESASQRDELQRQLSSLLSETQSSRSSLIADLEAEAAVVIEAARTETAALSAQLEGERQARAADQDRLRREYEAHCRGFESRLRAKVSRTISLLRQANTKPGADLTAILSPLVASVMPADALAGAGAGAGARSRAASASLSLGQGGQAAGALSLVQPASGSSSPVSDSLRLSQPVFADSPSSTSSAAAPSLTGRGASFAQGLAQSASLAAAIQGTRVPEAMATQLPQMGEYHDSGSAAGSAPSGSVSVLDPSFEAQADKLMATADDVLSAVLATMTPEQRVLWASIETRMNGAAGRQ